MSSMKAKEEQSLIHLLADPQVLKVLPLALKSIWDLNVYTSLRIKSMIHTRTLSTRMSFFLPSTLKFHIKQKGKKKKNLMKH